jgi:hypothetical protein
LPDIDGHLTLLGSAGSSSNGSSDDDDPLQKWLAETRAWLRSEMSSAKNGQTAPQTNALGFDSNAVVADSVKQTGEGLQFVGETAAVLDPSGIISATQSAAKGKNGEAILMIGLALIPGGKKAEEAVHVYQIVKDGKVIYVGITNNLERRAIEQGMPLKKIVTMGTRLDARSVEQALIQHHGLEKNGGALMNKINSISPRNLRFTDYVKMGFDVLRSVGYPL